mmetsp:Transcript_6737/g.13847  ORF Transcript_6737/g.13847 Transcript_6737/m.13847 type:complete len:211 (-) Transcript_6737:74-706(-)
MQGLAEGLVGLWQRSLEVRHHEEQVIHAVVPNERLLGFIQDLEDAVEANLLCIFLLLLRPHLGRTFRLQRLAKPQDYEGGPPSDTRHGPRLGHELGESCRNFLVHESPDVWIRCESLILRLLFLCFVSKPLLDACDGLVSDLDIALLRQHDGCALLAPTTPVLAGLLWEERAVQPLSTILVDKGNALIDPLVEVHLVILQKVDRGPFHGH